MPFPFRRAPSGPRPARRLVVESLEDRITPAVTSFDPSALLPLSQATLVLGVAVADFTGDGKPDVAVGFSNGEAYPYNPAKFAIFPSTGGGAFGSPQVFDAGTGSYGGWLATGDFNNDGRPDLVVTAGGSNALGFGNRVSINLGNGAGGFAPPIVFTTLGSDTRTVVADFNEDRNADLAIYTSDESKLAVHFGDGTGRFPTATYVPVAPWRDQSAGQHLAADLNGDGHTDLAVPLEGGSNQVKVFFGSGAGTFSAGPVLGVPGGTANVRLGMVAADLDEDGLRDLTVAAGNRAYVFRGTGGGNFTPTPTSFPALPSGDSAYVTDAADFDGDGHTDLVVGNWTGQAVAVLRGDGRGSLVAPETYAARAGSGYDLRAADLDGDGRPDVAAASMNNAQPGVSVLLNRTPVEPGLVGWWAGNGTGRDSSGRAHDATPHNGVGFTPAVAGDGFRFDGVDDYLRVPDHPDFRFTTAFTIEGWVRVDQLPPQGYASPIAHKDSQSSGQRSYSLSFTADGHLYTEVFGNGTDASAAIRRSAAPLPLGAFAHVAVVYDGSAGRHDLYINGRLSNGAQVHNSGAVPASLYPSTQPVYVGAYLQGVHPFPSYSRIAVDELKMFNRALTGAELQAEHAAGNPNRGPTASPGGPYATTYGSGLTLNGSGSSDPDGDALTYSWTVNGHAAATGATPTLTWADLQALGVTTAGSYPVRLAVSDGRGGTASSADVALTVGKAAQVISFAPLADKTYGDGPVTLSAAGGGSGNPVTFGVSGPAVLGADGVTLTITGAGTVTVTASQAGNANYDPAAPVTRSFAVARYTPTGSIAAVPAAAYTGTVHGTTGSVLGVGGAVLSNAVSYTDAAGTAVAAPVNAGTYTAAVSFPGDGNYTARTFTTAVVINKATLTVTADNKSMTYGGSVPALTASYTGFVNGETAAVLSGAPALSTTATPASGPGAYPITASAGTLSAANYAFAFAGGTLTVVKAPTATAASVSAPTPLYGVDGVTLSAAVSVTAGGGTPTGTVVFYDGATLLGTATLAGGTASLALAPGALAVGPHTIRAVYGGDANFDGSQSTAAVNVLAPSTIQGLVYVDFNDDGQVDFGEKAVPGVTVTLTGTDDLGNPVHRTAQTDAQGVYAFTNLRPSSGPGYTITETQPAGLPDGRDTLGTVGTTAVGSAANDTFSGVAILQPGSYGQNYNFGERPAADGSVAAGQTAAIGFWQNGKGQALIQALNGGPSATQLGHWLATTFPNLYAGLDGKTNAEVAGFYKALFARTARTAPDGPPKTDAQVMATALAVYVTNQTLAGSTATAYGFLVTDTGVGTRTFDVGGRGAAFGVANNSRVTVLDLLLAVNARSKDGLLYDLDGDGRIGGTEAGYRTMANDVFSAINEAGSI